MAEERHQLASNVSEISEDIQRVRTNSLDVPVETTQIVMTFQIATVRVESWALVTKLSVRGHEYYFDHVTGRLMREENITP